MADMERERDRRYAPAPLGSHVQGASPRTLGRCRSYQRSATGQDARPGERHSQASRRRPRIGRAWEGPRVVFFTSPMPAGRQRGGSIIVFEELGQQSMLRR